MSDVKATKNLTCIIPQDLHDKITKRAETFGVTVDEIVISNLELIFTPGFAMEQLEKVQLGRILDTMRRRRMQLPEWHSLPGKGWDAVTRYGSVARMMTESAPCAAFDEACARDVEVVRDLMSMDYSKLEERVMEHTTKDGFHCRRCGDRLMVKNVCTVYCPKCDGE